MGGRARMRWSEWDGRLFSRAAAAAGAALALALLVTAATDEGGVPWGARAGRTLPLAPLCAAVGAAAALAPVRWRGEAVAVAALGRSRLELVAAAVAGGALVALGAAALLALPRVDIAGFYPSATHGSAWTWDGAAFVDHVHGLSVGADGAARRVTVDATASAAGLPPHARLAAATATALAGVALPLLLAHALLARPAERGLERRDAAPLALAFGAMAASLVLFQAAAAHQAPALLATLPVAALLAGAAQRYRSSP